MARSTSRPESARPLSASRLRLRPLGYLLGALVWTAIFGMTVFLWFVMPGMLGSSGPLKDSPGMAELSDPAQAIAFGIVMLLLAVILGYVLLFFPLTTAACALLCFAFATRALQSRYNDSALSATTWSAEVIGPPTLALMPRAVSLIPVHSTRYSDALSTVMLLGFMPGWRLLFTSIWFGLAYLFTIGWWMWPTSGTVLVIVFGIVSALVGAFGIYAAVRSAVRRVGALRERAEKVTAEAQTA
jgi:hypothetical protein